MCDGSLEILVNCNGRLIPSLNKLILLPLYLLARFHGFLFVIAVYSFKAGKEKDCFATKDEWMLGSRISQNGHMILLITRRSSLILGVRHRERRRNPRKQVGKGGKWRTEQRDHRERKKRERHGHREKSNPNWRSGMTKKGLNWGWDKCPRQISVEKEKAGIIPRVTMHAKVPHLFSYYPCHHLFFKKKI